MSLWGIGVRHATHSTEPNTKHRFLSYITIIISVRKPWEVIIFTEDVFIFSTICVDEC
jgi:hypothetical protein